MFVFVCVCDAVTLYIVIMLPSLIRIIPSELLGFQACSTTQHVDLSVRLVLNVVMLHFACLRVSIWGKVREKNKDSWYIYHGHTRTHTPPIIFLCLVSRLMAIGCEKSKDVNVFIFSLKRLEISIERLSDAYVLSTVLMWIWLYKKTPSGFHSNWEELEVLI